MVLRAAWKNMAGRSADRGPRVAHVCANALLKTYAIPYLEEICSQQNSIQKLKETGSVVVLIFSDFTA